MLVYKATSKTTNKSYIGITTNTLEYRKNQHKKAAEDGKCYHFYEAIRKYGFEDFEWEIVEDNIASYEILNQREQYWIKYFNTYEEGYNSTRGGDGVQQRDDEWILKLFMEGHTVKEICAITGYVRSTIYRAFQSLQLTEDNNQRKKDNIRQRCSYAVLQYDLQGNFIKEWPSLTSCQEIGNPASIGNVCRGQQLTAYGFLWKYKNDETPITLWVERNNDRKSSGKPQKKICQLDNEGNIINEYNSAADAARALNLNDKSNICAAARKGKRAYGYYWQYKIEN